MTTSRRPHARPEMSSRQLLETGLRAEIIRFKERSPRGLVRPTVWVGRPGGPAECLPEDPSGLDWCLRVETAGSLCDRVRDRVPRPVLWLTRTGPLEPSNLDEAWWAATRTAWEEQDLSPAFAVVTRHGWRLQPAGLRREWRRVR